MTTEKDLIKRTKHFALRIIKLSTALSTTDVGQVIGKQLLRAGTSVGSNYRAACRGRSTAEFISKLGIVEEEADETMYWLELIMDAELKPSEQITSLWTEANEILSIIVASRKTARANNRKSQI